MARVNGAIAVLLFAALTAVVALQVANRLVLHLPLIWSEEVARFLFFWLVLLGAALSVRRRRHFVLDLTLGRRTPLGRTGRFLFSLVPDVCVLGFALFLAVEGWGYAGTGALRTASNSGINMALVYAALPTFALLTVLYSVANLMADVRAFRSGMVPPPPTAAAE